MEIDAEQLDSLSASNASPNADYLERMGHKFFSPEKETEYGRDTQIRDNVTQIPFRIETLGDYAYLGFHNTSWTPERSAMLTECAYTSTIALFCKEILDKQNTGEAMIELQCFASKLHEKYLEYLVSHSRCASAAIVGPSKFPTQRAEKAAKAAGKKMQAVFEFVEQSQNRIKKKLGLIDNLRTAISSDDKDAVSKLRTKLELLKKRHEMEVEANKVVRKKNMTEEQKRIKLLELGFSQKEIDRECNLSGTIDKIYFFPTNTNAEIHRIEGRIKLLEKKQSDITKELVFSDGKLIDNVEANRVQLLFTQKPDTQIIQKLKSYGFRWSPRYGTWQRQRTEEALRIAKIIANLPQNTLGQMAIPTTQPQNDIVEFTPTQMPWEISLSELKKINLLLREKVDHYDRYLQNWKQTSIAEISGSTPKEQREKFNKELLHRKKIFEQAKVLMIQYDPLKHEQYIRAALAEGKNIPAEILADYPILQESPTPLQSSSLSLSTSKISNNESKSQLLLTQIDTVLQELEDKIESPETEHTIRAWLACQAKFHNYSLNNTWLLHMQAAARNMPLLEVASFRKWVSMKGVNDEHVCIKKGEKALQILYPMEFVCYEKEENGNYKLNEHGKKIPERDPITGQIKKSIWYDVGNVFNITQTNAKEIGAVADLDHRGKIVGITNNTFQSLVTRIQNIYKIPVEIKREPANAAGGWYTPLTNTITINTAITTENSQRLGTLLHELGHALIHGKDAANYKRNLKEGQAEAFAYATAKLFGVTRDSQLYIKGWIQNDLPLQDVLKGLSEHIRKAITDLQLHELAASEFAKITTEQQRQDQFIAVINTIYSQDTNNRSVKMAGRFVDGRATPEQVAVLYQHLQDYRRANYPNRILGALLVEKANQLQRAKSKHEYIDELGLGI